MTNIKHPHEEVRESSHFGEHAPNHLSSVNAEREALREKYGPLIPLREEVQRSPERSPEPPRKQREEPSDRWTPIDAPLKVARASSTEVRPAASHDSLPEGAAIAALGMGAAIGVLPAFANVVGSSLGFAGGKLGVFLAPSASQVAATVGIPAVGAAAGYYIGKKFNHPVAGTVVGTGAGMAGSLYALESLKNVWNLNTAFTSMGAHVALSSLATNVGIAAAGGAALYGLGRWHGKVWGSKPKGILGTMARGIVSPVSVPFGYMRNIVKGKAH